MNTLRLLSCCASMVVLNGAPAQTAAGVPPAALVESHGGAHPAHKPGADHATSNCLPPAERAAMDAVITENSARLGRLGLRGPVARYPFWPQGGTLGRDIFTIYFVDLDPTSGHIDYDCGTWTYDGHNGNDIDIRTFAEQAVGVPIFAALDGTVVAADDGHFDMNTTCSGPSNYVVIDHGGGQRTRYLHMRAGSVAVGVGDEVRAGQQIGLVGSSGCSARPHLHFETNLPMVYEPFAGACRAGDSGWVNQHVPDRTTTYLRDFGFNNTGFAAFPGPPQPFPRISHAAFDDVTLYYWMMGHNLPPGASFLFKFTRPDGTPGFQSATFVPPWTTAHLPLWWAAFGWNVNGMRTIAGTWRVQVLINGELMVEAPIEVLPVRDPSFNRRPTAAEIVLDPPAPEPSSVIFCRVTSSMLLDDPDYDLVSYRYVWKVNGATVRDVTTACLSDAIPRDTLRAGGEVLCSVTPTDAGGPGPTTTIRFGCAADYNASGAVSTQDLFDFLSGYFGGAMQADINGAGGLTVQDIFDYLGLYFAGCD